MGGYGIRVWYGIRRPLIPYLSIGMGSGSSGISQRYGILVGSLCGIGYLWDIPVADKIVPSSSHYSSHYFLVFAIYIKCYLIRHWDIPQISHTTGQSH